MADSRIQNAVPGRPYVTPSGASYPFQSEVAVNGDAYLDKGARSLCYLPSASYGTAIPASATFSTEFVSSMALDITSAGVSGGTASPTVAFLLDRQGLDSNWYNILTTSTAGTAPTSYSIDVGDFSIQFQGTNSTQHAVFTYVARLRWTFASGGTGVSMSASIVGRN
jgi:hypothetical protein